MDFGQIGVGLVIAFAGMGSAAGTGTAGMAAIGAWKRAYQQGQAAPFLLMVFVGMPLTQTIYGFLLMEPILERAQTAGPEASWLLLGIGIAGLAIGASALFQGKAAAGACDAYGETRQGFVNYIIALGIVETVALFVMVFALIQL